ncbi:MULTISPECIES: hypothetical protein [unclassified Streptomyces]|uniref:hypothetical protein n=1 Tax=unclassified Streptomyces TaxID=2593676 RepID=UPI001BE905A3|nr:MULTISPECIES: hypothetical protein [unclassified Streptomyces]MBT2408915.1 hypothetical protein [Streptomyces sp. ISL-21]MBT2458153.1 hypothetical protein [Streptomyces sp. ISL-86]MBT2606863.1 hypothetical protein [Streptomyces sp. ISL-87]
MNAKKIATVAGVATAGIALFVATQGSAQAAPAQPVQPVASAPQTEDSTQALGSLLGKAATSVGKAATKGANKAVAVGKGMAVVANSNADNMMSHGRIIGSSPADLPEGVDTNTLFDR